MLFNSALLAFGLVATAPATVHALLRFSCSQLVVERLDPQDLPFMPLSWGERSLTTRFLADSSTQVLQLRLTFIRLSVAASLPQNAFNVSMSPLTPPPSLATCTTCTFASDFSNYWTAVLYFRARNGSYHRVPQKPNVGFEQANGGMTIYYTPYVGNTKSTVTAFRPGFRMLVGQQGYRTKEEAKRYRQLTYTCLKDPMTRTGETIDFPKEPCKAGVMTNVRFPTCWDGQNLDSPDHQSHVSYPLSGTFESNGPCPSTHPVKIPQLFYEVIWDTSKFNDKSLWPADGISQPFVWSQGDATGYGNHGDYVFGWKDDALQKAMDSNCNINCPQLKTQSIGVGNKCGVKDTVGERVDGWLGEIPGGIHEDGPSMGH